MCSFGYVLANGWSCKPNLDFIYIEMKKFLCSLIVFCICVSWLRWFVSSQDLNSSVADMELLKYYGVVPLLLNIHKEIWMWESWDEVISSYSLLVQNMMYYADIDVVQYLKKSVYPEVSLNNFLDKTQSALNTADSFLMYISNNKELLVQQKENCDSSKVFSDKNFVLALKDYDSLNMEKNLHNSIEKEKCSVESRIMYNAYDKMGSQIMYYYNILQNKYDYFFSNKYDIVQLISN